MAKEEKKAPKLRFNGYTNDWERKKLGEIGSVSMNKRIFKDETSTIGEIPFYKIGTFGGKADAFITRKKYEEYKKKYPYPQKGNLLISASGSIGRIIEYNGEEAYYQDSNIVWLDHDNTILDVFLKPTYEIIKWDGIEGTTIKRLYNKNILNTVIYKPTIDEQRKIGKLFIILNNTIQLHERKYEELTLIKKALLQKLFPKKDGFKPEVRYKNFNDAWEQRKLGEVIISEHKGKVKSIMKGGNTNYLETNYLNGGTAQKVDAIADVSKDDVLILWDGSKAGTIYHGFEGALGSTLKAYVPKYSGDFLYQILKKNQDKIYQSYRTPNIPHVIKNFTEKFNVSIPTIIEQQEIGDFFKQLDSLITLHRRKLEKLKQLKKFLLQNMFI
ncbi:restriction endonuclease subunit S [Ligilactobacillus salivarius]|uniref:Type I restriction-modification system specificity subunit n=2 Tax=Ligilactobacillus salivarius TaxID=1624 RepID=Q1WTN4_LIGS1|nr:restriction endonuclease subunit S [Ligilactobacillus salivarius]ABD99728.1 Type I restriction-modification system specificity subunit [Ligilactobacillus salivarius UCC118]MYY70819.1 restriction endonuclease subunit S [Ligilactobacillus salivarius]